MWSLVFTGGKNGPEYKRMTEVEVEEEAEGERERKITSRVLHGQIRRVRCLLFPLVAFLCFLVDFYCELHSSVRRRDTSVCLREKERDNNEQRRKVAPSLKPGGLRSPVPTWSLLSRHITFNTYHWTNYIFVRCNQPRSVYSGRCKVSLSFYRYFLYRELVSR